MLIETSWSRTVRVVEAVGKPKVAEIPVVPLPELVASPCDPGVMLIVATVGDEELQFAPFVTSTVVPSLYRPVAMNCSVPPVGIEGPCGLISMASKMAVVTVRLAEPATAPEVAPMIVLPPPIVVTTPMVPDVLLTVATLETDELHCAELVTS